MEKITHRLKRNLSTIKKNQFENSAWLEKKVIIGIDEVGRGCLAGPVIAAATIITQPSPSPDFIKDSKLMSEKERLEAYHWIIANSRYSIGIIDHHAIDQHNIWRATQMAMKKALLHLLAINYPNCSTSNALSQQKLPSAILIDAMPLSLANTVYATIPIHSFTKGESLSDSIAAASILAKVTRDRLMASIDTLFPGYGIAKHKGYATAVHRKAIQGQGASLIHRASFLKNLSVRDPSNISCTCIHDPIQDSMQNQNSLSLNSQNCLSLSHTKNTLPNNTLPNNTCTNKTCIKNKGFKYEIQQSIC